MKFATVFSGIGAPEYALFKDFPELKPKLVFACDCGEFKGSLSQDDINEIRAEERQDRRQALVKEKYKKIRKNHYVKETYFQNYGDHISENKWFDDIRFIDGRPFKGKIDLFIGGSPCQSFSLQGKRKGLEDTRGTLFHDYARLIKEIEPKVFIYENVPGMLAHEGGRTWEIIKGVFSELGYKIRYSILNASDFDIPQNRRRLFVVGIKKEGCSFEFPKGHPLDQKNVAKCYLDKTVDPKYFLGKKGFEFVTNPKYAGRAKINADVIKTQKKNQQFNWNGDFVFCEKGSGFIPENAYVSVWRGKTGAVRKMTPVECHRLMGFKDDFKPNEKDVPAYMQAGNSIVVNVISAVIKEIVKSGALND